MTEFSPGFGHFLRQCFDDVEQKRTRKSFDMRKTRHFRKVLHDDVEGVFFHVHRLGNEEEEEEEEEEEGRERLSDATVGWQLFGLI